MKFYIARFQQAKAFYMPDEPPFLPPGWWVWGVMVLKMLSGITFDWYENAAEINQALLA